MSTLPVEQILNLLKTAEIDLEGEFVHGYNYTFLVKVQPEDGESFLAVYKPQQGEQPLWDFPENTLAHRETAAFLVSQALGWDLVPPTVYRGDGPFGPAHCSPLSITTLITTTSISPIKNFRHYARLSSLIY